jgi:hypothetical protein
MSEETAHPAHPDPPSQAGREMCPDVHPVGMGMFGVGGGVVGVEDVARDRTVHRLLAARPVADRRQADRPGRPNSAE